jgi:glucosylceramidase
MYKVRRYKLLLANSRLAFLRTAFLVVSALCSNLCCAAPQELVLNGGFESGSGSPDNWASRGNGGYAVWKNDSWGQTGTWYVIAGTNGSSDQYQEWVQTIAVVSGTSFAFSVDSRTENWGTPTGYIQIDWKNAMGTTISSTQKILFSGSKKLTWARYSTGAMTVPPGAVTADFILHGGYYGTILFDQVSVIGEKFVNPDFNGDYIADFEDFSRLAGSWLKSSTIYDMTSDNYVDIYDLAIFASDWLGSFYPPYQGYEVVVNDAVKYQTIDGFGASLTDSSAYLIGHYLNSTERTNVLKDLFDPNTGIGLTYLRQPMGSSDFRHSVDYSYDEVPSGSTDYNLTSFSINYDTTYIIPVLQEALAISPDIKIMGTPWSPPRWMKNTTAWGSGSLINDDRVYRALANYFVKYIQAYAEWGIDINAVTLQNEPYYEPGSYPGMRMEPADQIRLVKFMRPFFDANGIDTKILTWDHNWDNTAFVLTVYADSVARSYFDGSAWHHYGGDVSAQTTVHNAYPAKNIYFTEGSDGTWNDGGFSADLIRNGNFVVDVIRNWAKTVVKWNLALDQYNGPKIAGGCDTCYGFITINSVTHAVSHRPHYYAIGQASKFVRLGAVRIDSTPSPGANIKNVSFQNPDGSIVCFVVNQDASPHNLRIAWNTLSFIYTLPASSISTFVWQPGSNEVNVWITSGDGTKLLQKQHTVYFQ